MSYVGSGRSMLGVVIVGGALRAILCSLCRTVKTLASLGVRGLRNGGGGLLLFKLLKQEAGSSAKSCQWRVEVHEMVLSVLELLATMTSKPKKVEMSLKTVERVTGRKLPRVLQ
jgi:hypothetical protein